MYNKCINIDVRYFDIFIFCTSLVLAKFDVRIAKLAALISVNTLHCFLIFATAVI